MTMGSFTKVGDLMSPTPVVVDGLQSVANAMALMREKGVNALVINRRHDGDEFGMVTVNDIADKVMGLDRSLERTSVYEIMTKPVVTIDSGMNVKYAMRLLARLQIRRAIVVNNNEMVGIVTMGQLVLQAK